MILQPWRMQIQTLVSTVHVPAAVDSGFCCDKGFPLVQEEVLGG